LFRGFDYLLAGFIGVWPSKPLTATTDVVTVFGVLGAEESDEIPFVSIKLGSGLNFGKEGVNRPHLLRVFTHGGVEMRTFRFAALGVGKLILKILFQVVTLVLADVVFSRDVIDDQVDEHSDLFYLILRKSELSLY